MNIPNSSTARLLCPVRDQAELFGRTLDDCLPPDHRVRDIWDYVNGLDLSAFYQSIRAVEGHAGHPAVDPRIHLSLWLLAITDNISSARALDRLCDSHAAYRWLCGGVGVNYHTLSAFRSNNRAFFDQLLTDSVGTLVHQGLVELDEVAQDGVRVRASAGAKSFRRAETLERCLEQAKQHIAKLKSQENDDANAVNRRQQSAQERAARERQERIEAAIAEQKALEERRQQTKKEKGTKSREPRASTTDPDARTMKMGDGGFRPAFNVEFATDTQSGIVVGVEVVNVGSDSGQLKPMVEQIEERYEVTPQRVLVDGDFAKLEDIEALENVEVFAPVKNAEAQKAKGIDPYQPRATDQPPVAAWRQRMGTEPAKEIYKRRASTAEWVNARARNMGLRQFLIRGLEKVRSVALLMALASNMLQAFARSKVAVAA